MLFRFSDDAKAGEVLAIARTGGVTVCTAKEAITIGKRAAAQDVNRAGGGAGGIKRGV